MANSIVQPRSLAVANTACYLSFLRKTIVLYPRFSASLLALSLLAVPAGASELLPSAPEPTTIQAPVRLKATDWAITGSMVVGRALDWSTTQELLRRPWGYEKELPAGLARSKVGLAAFEAGSLGLELYSQHALRRHGHLKAARAVGLFNASVSLGVDAHNWSIARR